MSKDKASEFSCNVSLKRIQAPDGSYIFKSDADEGGEGEFDDDGEEENDDKVPTFSSFNWAPQAGSDPSVGVTLCSCIQLIRTARQRMMIPGQPLT